MKNNNTGPEAIKVDLSDAEYQKIVGKIRKYKKEFIKFLTDAMDATANKDGHGNPTPIIVETVRICSQVAGQLERISRNVEDDPDASEYLEVLSLIADMNRKIGEIESRFQSRYRAVENLMRRT